MKVDATRLPESVGLDLAARLEAARRRFGELSGPPTMVVLIHPAFLMVRAWACPPADSAWAFMRRLLALDLIEAEADLEVHLWEHGPVETDRGIYRLDGSSKVSFRRHIVALPFRPGDPLRN